MQNAFLADLPAEDFVDAATGAWNPPTRPARGIDAKTIRFPCQPCRGTGNYQGVRTRQTNSVCFACKGKGYFMTSERDRQASRQSARTSKTRRISEARAAYDELNPGIAAFLASAAVWSSFAADILAKLNQYGALTEPQTRAIVGMRDKAAARQSERTRSVLVNTQTVDLQPIRNMFEAARTSGYKLPIYRAAGLIINRAPDSGRNPGALYVKSEAGEYLGKILGSAYTGKPAPTLAAIAADPRGEAIRYGQKTGNCSCCGRDLTAESSVAAGIGPICARKWGL
jgi:hypothetical protein